MKQVIDRFNKTPMFSIEDAKETKKKLEKKRVPVTLMMRPDLKELLGKIADNKRTKMSVVLEKVLLDYFDKDI